MSKVQAQTKSVKQLLTGVKYGIDFYQREYEWQRRHVEDLLNDFESRFNSSFSPEHERFEVSNYQHYFLGTIITIAESGKRFIVDGQQRLTTLTLLLIHIHHLRKQSPAVFDVVPLIFSSSFGQKSFNIDMPERRNCMESLFRRGGYDAKDHPDLSVRNLASRFEELDELFPEALKGATLPFFTDWLIECVDLVEIEAQSDDDAFTIFETMNDRGLNLGQADMLKGYLLANINSSNVAWMHDKKTEVNSLWKERIRELADLGDGEEDDFFKSWLRAKYADTIRERKKGAANRDFENINKYHRWVRDSKQRLELQGTQDFYDFVKYRINRFAGHYVWLRKASIELQPGNEEIYYNLHNNFTLQYMLALAPLCLEDDFVTARAKMRLVARFIDIYLARRMVNFRWNGYNHLYYAMFILARDIRDNCLSALQDKLLAYLDRMDDTFSRVTAAHHEPFSRNSYTGRSIRYLLARMTAWVEQGTGNTTTFPNYLHDAEGKPYEIEHIWADKYERHDDDFDSEEQFHRVRNYFAGLVLLPRGTNQSFGDMPYEDKVQHYLKENLLAASLHPKNYDNNPNFANFVKRTGLPFKPHALFKQADLMERQQLYRQICEQIWSPDRLLEDN